MNTYTRISEECPTAIHSVELWLKGLAAAIANRQCGHAQEDATPEEALCEPARSEQCRNTALCQLSHQERAWIPHRHLCNREQFFY